MNNIIQKTRQFNEMFQELPNEPKLDKEAIYQTIALLNEEIKELKLASELNDFDGVRDAFADIMFVLCGGYNKCGLDSIALSDFMAVSHSNMAKFYDNEEDAKNDSEYYEKLGTPNTIGYKLGKYFLTRNIDGKLIKPVKWQVHDFVKIDI